MSIFDKSVQEKLFYKIQIHVYPLTLHTVSNNYFQYETCSVPWHSRSLQKTHSSYISTEGKDYSSKILLDTTTSAVLWLSAVPQTECSACCWEVPAAAAGEDAAESPFPRGKNDRRRKVLIQATFVPVFKHFRVLEFIHTYCQTVSVVLGPVLT